MTVIEPQSQSQAPLLDENNKPIKVAKLRTSCDACLTAKVRCEKASAACRRCLNQGLACQYSPSLRAGKPPKRRADSTVTSRATTPARTRCPSTPAEPMRAQGSSRSSVDSGVDMGLPQPMIMDDFMSDCDPMSHHDLPFVDPSWISLHDQHMNFQDGMKAQYMLNDAMSQLGCETPFRESFTPQMPFTPMMSPRGSVTYPFDGIPGMSAMTDLSAASQGAYSTVASPSMPIPIPTPSSNQDSDPESNASASFAFNTLAMLYQPDALAEINFQSGLSSPGGNRLDDFQRPLQTIHAAVDNVKRILLSPQPVREDVALVCISIISKVLGWFQTVMFTNGMNTISNGLPSRSGSSSPQPNGNSAGNFRASRWEADAEALLRQTSLLAEMKDIAWLVDTLAERQTIAVNESQYVQEHLTMLCKSLKHRLGTAMKNIAGLMQTVAKNYQ